MNNSPGSSNVNDNMSPSSNISEYSSYIQNLNLETNYEIASYNEHQPSTSTNFQQPQCKYYLEFGIGSRSTN